MADAAVKVIEMNDEDVLPLDLVAREIGAAERTVRDPRWRRAVGLHVLRVGRRIVGVRRGDLRAAMRRGF
jgi:hypothetical protein